MRLIDIDPLKERIDKEVKEGKVLDGWAFFIKAYLDSEPNINIVRCVECKYLYVDTADEGTSCYWCGVWANATDEDVFCSYGKRKERGER